MAYTTCDHLKEDGVYCDSPALRGHNYCYYHLSVRGRRLKMARARARGEACRLQLPVLDDMHAVQSALMQVLDALADDRIDPKRAGLILYALQQASTNLIATPGWKGSRERVRASEPLRALECPDFNQQYDLPNGVNLDLPPDVALQAAEQSADSPQKPKERHQRARMPERAASQVDKYFHIPKDPEEEVSFDEILYNFSRRDAGEPYLARITEAARAGMEGPPRPGPASVPDATKEAVTTAETA